MFADTSRGDSDSEFCSEEFESDDVGHVSDDENIGNDLEPPLKRIYPQGFDVVNDDGRVRRRVTFDPNVKPEPGFSMNANDEGQPEADSSDEDSLDVGEEEITESEEHIWSEV